MIGGSTEILTKRTERRHSSNNDFHIGKQLLTSLCLCGEHWVVQNCPAKPPPTKGTKKRRHERHEWSAAERVWGRNTQGHCLGLVHYGDDNKQGWHNLAFRSVQCQAYVLGRVQTKGKVTT